MPARHSGFDAVLISLKAVHKQVTSGTEHQRVSFLTALRKKNTFFNTDDLNTKAITVAVLLYP